VFCLLFLRNNISLFSILNILFCLFDKWYFINKLLSGYINLHSFVIFDLKLFNFDFFVILHLVLFTIGNHTHCNISRFTINNSLTFDKRIKKFLIFLHLCIV